MVIGERLNMLKFVRNYFQTYEVSVNLLFINYNNNL